MSQEHKHTNKLINETSPYLLQHAQNPVDWYPWGEEALAKAKRENKPIFLSIGYAACHWCHVMERESFENEEIAEILNKHFISIKVDREERPDLDDIYMTAVVAISGSGGWPMTIFLTPELKPFYGGTYFPPDDKWGRVGFKNLILRLIDFWQNDQSRTKLHQDAETLSRIVEQRTSISLPVDEDAQLSTDLLANASHQLEAAFDDKWGGFSSAPKFPPSNAVMFLLRDYFHTGNKRSLEMATFTLDKMYEGGMYDHLAGGFHRYAVDQEWLVPHFEKMLYDNAQLAVVYIEAYQATGNNKYARIAQEIFDYEMTYMTNDSGGIYSTEDADSQGKEGIFYLWKWDELDGILGKKEADIISRYYSTKKMGNFPSHEDYHKEFNILHIRRDAASVAKELGMTEEQLKSTLSSIKKKLLEVRDKRARPGLDDKTITSWNGLMISAFARGYQVFADKRYLSAAERAASFVMDKMRTEDGKLLRTHRAGASKFHAYLEDYSYLILALVDLYEAGFDKKWLFSAEDLTEEMIVQFWDEKSDGLFNTSLYHKNLIVRTKSVNDSAIPSPVGVAIESFLRLGKLLDKEDYLKKARRVLKANHPYMEKAPQGYLTLLMNVDYLIHSPKEIAIVGRKDSKDTKELLKAIHSRFIPNRVIAFLDPSSPDARELAKKIPLLSGREIINGKATVYVCENFTCQLPVTSPEDLINKLLAK
ncbi:MAG: thioredoxin domain-containing protein [Candidatus Aminicenantes bacterium]|nr:MAG: thioredoxin domain-containing protein [Candidatus Aminicenantes bacterium]